MQCELCYELGDDFYTLECQHVVCRSCIQPQMKVKEYPIQFPNASLQSNAVYSSNSIDPKTEKRILINCKVCQHLTVMEDQQELQGSRGRNNYPMPKSEELSLSQGPDTDQQHHENQNQIPSEDHQSVEQKAYFQPSEHSSEPQNQEPITKSRRSARNSNPSASVICLSCDNCILSVDEFLNSKHRSHNVDTIEKQYPRIIESLQHIYESLEEAKEVLFKRTKVLLDSKRHLNTEFSFKTEGVKAIFQELREALERQQSQALRMLEQKAQDCNQQIAKFMDLTESEIGKCNMYQQWIDSNVQTEQFIEGSQEVLSCVEFYSLKSKQLNQFAEQNLSQRSQRVKNMDMDASLLHQINPRYKQSFDELINKTEIFTSGSSQSSIKTKSVGAFDPQGQERYQKIKRTKLKQSQNYFQSKKRQILEAGDSESQKEISSFHLNSTQKYTIASPQLSQIPISILSKTQHNKSKVVKHPFSAGIHAPHKETKIENFQGEGSFAKAEGSQIQDNPILSKIKELRSSLRESTQSQSQGYLTRAWIYH